MGGVATFKVEIFRISKFIVGDPGEPYCKIPIKSLKLLKSFWEQLLIIQRLSFVNLHRAQGHTATPG